MNKEIVADSPNATPKLKMGEKLGFMTMSGSINIVYLFRNTYYLFFMTEVLRLPMSWAGLIVSFGLVFDAINDPAIGYWALNRRFKNGEYLRPFALWHAIPWAATVVLMFTDFGVSNRIAAAIAIIIFIFYETFNTTVGLPYNGMSGLATNRDSDRRSLNVFRNLGACIGSGVGALACLPLLRLFGALNSEGNLNPETAARGFIIVAFIMGVIMTVGCLIHYNTTKERVKQVSEEDERIEFMRAIKMLFKCRSWLCNAVFIIGYGIITMLLMSSLAYYATYVLGSTAAATMIQAAFLVANIAASFIVTPIDKRLGRRKTMMLTAVVAILGKIWFLANPFSAAAMYLNAITIGISVAGSFVLFNVNRNSIVDIIEADNGRRIDSMVATTDNLASKLATSGAMLLMTMLLSKAGYNADLAVQPDGVINVICFLIGWVTMITSVVMLVATYFLPIEKEFAEAVKKLKR